MSKSYKSYILGFNELRNLVVELPQEGIIILRGDLSSGKTTLVKEIVKFHGLDDVVTSPTFSVMQNYGEIWHYDIYNAGYEGLVKNGLFENFFENGLHLVEWGDENLEKSFDKFELSYCIVEIKNLGDKREYRVYK
ncbi:MAG: tRNA (adenosine(37)-N6)-threonylcarbamoyltransferase complex ATPase subunit type 1 TsaE [Campylobacter sp.]|nr:tRNA (adenosine(37)-N6)-threonylcarbamoyltransferase complex ATPase subunit type 1 TsaE [Campylobacter sp.]